VPRLAQRRVILFFCPTRASSANQISMGLPLSSQRSPPGGPGTLFESRYLGFAPGVMTRTSGELAVAQRPHLTAQGLFRDRDPELLPEPLGQIDQAPTHDPVHRRDRAIVDARHQGGPMRVSEPGWLAGRLAVDQPLGPVRVEPHHPVPHDLPRNPTDPGSFGPARTFVDGRQGQQTPGLCAILARASDPANGSGIEVQPEWNRHGEPPEFAIANQTRPMPTRAKRVTLSETWY
jgi:hypothetical protein